MGAKEEVMATSRARFLVALGLATAFVGLSGDAKAQVASHTYMRVARHGNVADIPSSTYNSAFADASNALITDNGSNDELCWLTLARHDRWWFSGGGSTDVVDNQTEYENTQWNVVDAYLVVVNDLNWCDGLGSWGGCGWPIGGKEPFLVTRDLAVSTQAGIVFAHEFGHTVGLQHDDLGQQIMDPDVLTINDRKVKNSSVCNTFRTVFPGPCKNDSAGTNLCICSIVLPSMMEPPSKSKTAERGQEALLKGAIEPGFSNIPIEELARSFIVDRMPVEVEDFYGQQDVDVLVGMLQDPANDQYARTIVTLIGLISYGTDEDVLAISDYSETPDSAFSASMMALGTIAKRTGNHLALALLSEQFFSGNARRDRAAALGLALSGDARALEMLNEKASAERDVDRKRTFLHAVSENQRVAQGDLRQYYLQTRSAVPQRNYTRADSQGGKEKD